MTHHQLLFIARIKPKNAKSLHLLPEGVVSKGSEDPWRRAARGNNLMWLGHPLSLSLGNGTPRDQFGAKCTIRTESALKPVSAMLDLPC
jgi:hypothetical protein